MSDEIFDAIANGKFPVDPVMEDNLRIINEAPELVKVFIVITMLRDIAGMGPQLELLIDDRVLMCDFRRAYHELVHWCVQKCLDDGMPVEKIKEINNPEFECDCGEGHTGSSITE